MKKFNYKGTNFFYSIDNPNNDNSINFSNFQLEKLRRFVKSCFPGILGKTNYDLYFFDASIIDARALISKKYGGIIAFPSEMFFPLYKIIEDLISQKETHKILSINTLEEQKYFVDAIYEYMTMFIVLHELSHISRGHCGFADAKGLFCSENEGCYEQVDENKNFIKQTLEIDADSNAIFFLLNYVMWETIDLVRDGKINKQDHNPLLSELQIVCFSIYFLNILFNIDDLDTEIKLLLDNFYSVSHPFPSLRMLNIFMQIIKYASNFLPFDEINYFSYEAIGKCIAFDKEFAANGIFKNTLVAVASTEKGVLHLKKLYKEWNNLYKQISNYSFLKLDGVEVPKSMPYWVDEKGNMSETMFQTKKIKPKS